MFGVRHDLTFLDKTINRLISEPIVKGKILFYGHSLFTRWSPRWGHRAMEDDIRMKDGSQAVVNHGFGTSTAADLLFNYHRLVKPWEPRMLVIASFGNDTSRGYSAAETVNYVAHVCDYASTDFPGIPIICFSASVNIKRKGVDDYFTRSRDEYNELLRDFCAKRDNCTFIDLAQWPMFYTNPEDIGNLDKVREDIYVDDQVHFNQLGYDLLRDSVLNLLDAYL